MLACPSLRHRCFLCASVISNCERVSSSEQLEKGAHVSGGGFSSFSLASAGQGGFPQALHITHGWDTEEAFVFPIEVRGVMIPYAVGGTRRIEVFAQHQPPSFQEPQSLLELHRAERRDGLKVVLQPRHAHAQFVREPLDAQRLVEVLTEALDRAGNRRGVASQECQMTKPIPLLTFQESIDNFPGDERQEHPRFGRLIQEPGHPNHRVQQGPIYWTDGDGSHLRMRSGRDVTSLHEDLTDEGRSKIQAQTEEWTLL